MPRSIAITELASMLGVLSHPDRIRIVEELRSGERCVQDLAEALDCPQARISQHLSLLKSHRIVHKRRAGLRRDDDPYR